jgi:Arc/MetJ-type ribon-helix-helix transcriptional regulator
MTTVSVPIPHTYEAAIEALVKRGYGANRSDVIRKAIALLLEEEAVMSVLRAEQEVRDGKILRGDLREVLKKLK